MHAGVEALRPAPGAERDGQVRCALLRTHAEEIDWIADAIAHLVRTGKEPGEIAVLCRTAGDFAEIQGALVARDVPVEVVGLSGLLHLPEVADLVAVCEVLQDPGANASLVRLLTGPRWRIGPRDLASGVATLARRLGTGKEQISLDAAHVTVPIALDEFQDFLLQRATEFRDTHTVVVDDWDSFVAAVQTGWAKAFHCGSGECEDTIKAETAATPRCIPFDAPEETGVCVRCGQPSAYGKRVIFSRAY